MYSRMQSAKAKLPIAGYTGQLAVTVSCDGTYRALNKSSGD